ncbi:uncharacterized protein LOC127841186 isoform X2 [Dreissena polymorpha]|nr:uncharacterized protein LOC127841186 isoform X2 [Dreissena polymorpha]XP_052225809.1 uncharacterized protein LOC127841186 isoform X2 [Dreissena polymorpha]XP_052225810.1 uncharacterized protein LOC127841186 isoform X2 [Dreissena polymorpha]XP_052225811.1 uncharacterized protein LOC127841186 isoform X2 [Dreissena polymorpha]XP_052225812.1 uncharacterized protein LOC127841186 isoform X2 [Dreissena polymorpha]XP_052225813.1 uncharacterized protein LOC127841186 isoform X2 [Dreissena polymorpha]
MDENPPGIQPLYGYPEVEKGIKMDVTEEHVKANLKSFDGKKVEDSHWANQWWLKGCDSVTDENAEHDFVSVCGEKKKCWGSSVSPWEGRHSSILCDEDNEDPLLTPSLQLMGEFYEGKSVTPTEHYQIPVSGKNLIQLKDDTTLCGKVSKLILPDGGAPTPLTHTSCYLPTPPIACHKVHSPFARYRCKACGDEQSDEWHVSKLLTGKGGFGKVYQTDHFGIRLAIKQFNECNCKRVKGGECCDSCAESRQREIATLIQLQHHNIVTIMGHCEGHHEFLMELMTGGTIADLVANLVANKKKLGIYVILSYTIQVTQALDYIHEEGYIHRDLKGRNLLLDETRKIAKIADFGLTVRLQPCQKEVTDDGTPGTPVFMAPEAVSKGKFSKASDIWSLGCCVFEMATGKLPWNVKNDCQAIWQIGNAKDPPDIPDDVHPKLKHVIEWCMQIEPNKRPTTRELLQWLQDVCFDQYQYQKCEPY